MKLTHAYRITLLPGVMVQELAVSVKSGDDSYMPKAISIFVGNSESSLKEIKTLQIPRSVHCANFVCVVHCTCTTASAVGKR